jgi:glucose dehydrogenase
MSRRLLRACLSIGVVVAGLASIVVSGQSNAVNLADGTSKGEWPYYSGDVRGTRFSPLEQINASNFNKLEVAWRFKTDNLGTRPEYKLEGTPLMVKGVIYTTAGSRRAVIALDARTGEHVRQDPR